MKWIRNKNGFTLIEMMIVLLIISTLLLIAVPNMAKNSSVASSKGCDATVDLLQAQVGAYSIENQGKYPDKLEDLKEYVNRTECSDKTEILYDKTKGIVTKKKNENDQ